MVWFFAKKGINKADDNKRLSPQQEVNALHNSINVIYTNGNTILPAICING
jgi:hypothetical protein